MAYVNIICLLSVIFVIIVDVFCALLSLVQFWK